ncbi:glycerol-3-phosphate responsive antiterminator [Pseudalkalibacillus berkeleyi]|uniref:Glycerol uptake operon antiterminator regulatory protein n=1 Tax=Pseudalkalibacillus berkeleyi TaxID=1069813 RepID=A0ABS9GYQ7_9BACL|nr:glycerol-3-phosphate responsive antiterminator [Pseudalkalibacillus berkeleyi]MCF6136628.1 glycerol-3-phosphate responsive antiterminator [Pseudalkalibacillus berkeleyi]
MFQLTKHNPMVAAVRDISHLDIALNSNVEIISMMAGNLSNISEIVERIHAKKKQAFLHVDLIKGLANNNEAVDFLAEKVKPTGIVTTKGRLIKKAKECDLTAIQHNFIIDTQAFSMSVRSTKQNQPDAVEMMPGLMPRVIKDLKAEIDLPLIVGGLLNTETEIKEVLNAGASAVVSGNPDLWHMNLMKMEEV